MNTAVAVDHVRTGIAGLDEILLGGVRKGNIVLVEGAPGTGKTTLGLEFIYRGARELDETGLIFTFELSPEKVLADAAGFGWDLQSLVDSGKVKIVYTNPAVIIEELQTHDGVLANEIRTTGAKRLLIDGLTPLKLFGEAADARPFRESLHLLVESVQRFGVTGLLTREAGETPGRGSDDLEHERFVGDTIITLTRTTRRRSVRRFIEITKSRGQDFIGGQHTLHIVGGRGIEVYRRTQSRPKVLVPQPTSVRRSSIGNDELDRMLGGGLLDGSITLTVGISGTGKTVLGMHFLVEGLKRGAKTLLVSMDEHPLQILRNAEGLGLTLAPYMEDGSLLLHYDSPLELELDVHFDAIVKLIEQHQVRRVLIDSLAVYEDADEEESRDFIYALSTYLKNHGITAILNYESPELLGLSQISRDLKASTIVDNIILLNYVEISTNLRRAITVPKVRGSNNSKRTREFRIGDGGMAILDENAGEAKDIAEVPQLPFSSYYGLLARSPARRSPVIEESVIKGEELPASPKLENA